MGDGKNRNAPCFCGSGKKLKHCHGASVPKKILPAVTIFIDESFDQWMGLHAPESNFVYGTIFVPSANCDRLETGWEEIETRIRAYFTGRKRNAPAELKFNNVYGKLKGSIRDETLHGIKDLFAKCDVSIMAFFSTVEGLLNNLLREENFDNIEGFSRMDLASQLKEIDRLKTEILDRWKARRESSDLSNQGDFALTGRLFQYLGGCIAGFRNGYFGEYKLIVDPRGEDDAALQNCFETQLHECVDKMYPGALASYQGMEFPKSDHRPGLRAADFAAGMVRQFFTKNIGILEDGSLLKILDARYNPDMTIVSGTGPFYKKPLGNESVARLAEVDGPLVLPLFTQFFADKMISAFAKYGEARNMNMLTRTVWDMAD